MDTGGRAHHPQPLHGAHDGGSQSAGAAGRAARDAGNAPGNEFLWSRWEGGRGGAQAGAVRRERRREGDSPRRCSIYPLLCTVEKCLLAPAAFRQHSCRVALQFTHSTGRTSWRVVTNAAEAVRLIAFSAMDLESTAPTKTGRAHTVKARAGKSVPTAADQGVATTTKPSAAGYHLQQPTRRPTPRPASASSSSATAGTGRCANHRTSKCAPTVYKKGAAEMVRRLAA